MRKMTTSSLVNLDLVLVVCLICEEKWVAHLRLTTLNQLLVFLEYLCFNGYMICLTPRTGIEKHMF